MKYITVVPAYGRDYPSKAKAIADWNAGKDFRIQDISMGRDDGRYTSKRDWEGNSQVTINIRYKKLTMTAVVKPPKEKS